MLTNKLDFLLLGWTTNPLGLTQELQKALKIPLLRDMTTNEKFAEALMRVEDLATCARTAIGTSVNNVKETVLKIVIGDETFYIYEQPDDVDEDDWKEFCTILCEAGYIMPTPEYNKAAKKRLIALDSILSEALRRYTNEDLPSIYVDDRDLDGLKINTYTEEQPNWELGLVANYEDILLSGYSSGTHAYDIISEYALLNDALEKSPERNKVLVDKILLLFNKIGLDNIEEITEIIRDVNNLNTEKGLELLNLAFKTPRNQRLLTRRATLYEANELYKDYV